MERTERDRLLVRANLLALLTIGYNFVEEIISMALVVGDETLALVGFGVDSFIGPGWNGFWLFSRDHT